MRTLILEPEAYSKEAVEALKQVGEVLIPEKGDYARHLPEADIIMVGVQVKVDREFIDKAKNLKIIGSPTTGMDHLDAQYLARRGITIITLKDSPVVSDVKATIEHTIGLMLSLSRRLPWYFDMVRSYEWDRYRYETHDLKGMTLGIIGFGRIGRSVSRIAASLEMKVLAYDPYVAPGDFDNASRSSLQDLLSQSDIVTVHAALNEETVNLLDRKRLFMMKKGAYLINTARANIVDEVALLEALKKGHLAGAALDVLSDETGRNPTIKNSLVEYARAHTNLIITPHIGGATTEAMHKTSLDTATRVVRFIRDNLSHG